MNAELYWMKMMAKVLHETQLTRQQCGGRVMFWASIMDCNKITCPFRVEINAKNYFLNIGT